MKYTLVIFALFTSAYLFAQQDFRKGYYITHQHDTIFGLIDYQGDESNSYRCRFRASEKEEIQVFKPGDIDAYRFTESGKYYVSKEVMADSVKKTVFLEFLVKGKISFYYYRDKAEEEHYFVERDSSSLISLPKLEKSVLVDGTEYRKRDYKSISILEWMMQDYPEINKRLGGEFLDHKPLISIAKEYHQKTCGDNGCIIYQKTTFPITFYLEPTIGYTQYTFAKEYSDIISISNSTQFGLLLYNWMPRTSEKLFFKTGFLYNQYVIQSKQYNPPTSSMLYNIASNNVRVYRIPLIFQYRYPKGKLKPTFGAGWNLIFAKNSGIERTVPVELGLVYDYSSNIKFNLNYSDEYNSFLMPLFTDDKLIHISRSLFFGVQVRL